MKNGSHNRILAVGWYAPEGARHWVIRKGLTEAGWVVTDAPAVSGGFLSKCAHVCKTVLCKRNEFDVLLVPFQGHHVMPLVWILGKMTGKPTVFDVFISLYDSMVCDRGLVHKKSFKALRQRWIDRIACASADLLLIDTDEHAQYFMNEYGIAKEKFVTVPIGCKDAVFRPLPHSAHDGFEVLFHGTFIPLQGIDTIIRAAALLKDRADIRFTLVGKGQTFAAMQKLADSIGATNVIFEGALPLEKLPERIAHADVCLGIFGASDKADRVIPHKAYEIIACEKPLLTGSSRSARSFFEDRNNALLVNMNDPRALADGILTLKNDAALRANLARNGRRLFLEKCAPRTIVSPLIERLETLR